MTTIAHSVLGPYTPVADLARLHYGRLLWKSPRAQERLLRHWSDEQHPYSHRFLTKYRSQVERILAASEDDDAILDQELRASGSSLRTIVREIPPVLGSFY